MDIVLTELFYRDYLTGLSNPGSRVSYRELCCARDLGSSSGARRKCSERRSSDGDEKRRRNLKRWKIAASPARGIRELALAGVNFAGESAKYPRRFPSKRCIFVRWVPSKTPREYSGTYAGVHADVWPRYSEPKMIREKQGWEKSRCRLLWNFWTDDKFILNLIHRAHRRIRQGWIYVSWERFIFPFLYVYVNIWYFKTNYGLDLTLNKLLTLNRECIYTKHRSIF